MIKLALAPCHLSSTVLHISLYSVIASECTLQRHSECDAVARPILLQKIYISVCTLHIHVDTAMIGSVAGF